MRRGVIGWSLLVLGCGNGGIDSRAATFDTTRSTAPEMPAAAANPASPSRPEIRWGGTYHTVEGAPACVSKERFDEFRDYWSAKDNGALTEIIQSGECILLKPGLTVTPIDHVSGGMFGQSYVRARVFGTRTTMIIIPEMALQELRDP